MYPLTERTPVSGGYVLNLLTQNTPRSPVSQMPGNTGATYTPIPAGSN